MDKCIKVTRQMKMKCDHIIELLTISMDMILSFTQLVCPSLQEEGRTGYMRLCNTNFVACIVLF